MSEKNPNSRLEAFCDGVFAIALTLLIIDIKIPATEHISNTEEFWQALKHLIPSEVAFLLSFVIILITWVNHHAALKLVNKSTPHFIYANGLLLLTVVFVPFPTALLGEYILTDHAAPAVILYCVVCALQGVSWTFLTGTALSSSHRLTIDDKTTAAMRGLFEKSRYAFIFYGACAIAAYWFPVSVAVVVGISWIVWLIVGISLKDE